jgi:threonine 3-dehydrogenase
MQDLPPLPEKMKAVTKSEPQKGFKLDPHRELPPYGENDVLIKVKAASICGTDLHLYHWDKWAQGRVKQSLPFIVGHELCGEVVRRGKNVTTPNIGDFVSAESHIVCNSCKQCLTGEGHICRNTQIIGIDRDGAFAEYISLPAQNAWVNPADRELRIAVLMENFGNAVHTAFTADLRAKTVLVTGCGPVGIMTIAIAKALGAQRVIASDIQSYRLDLAEKMGATVKVNPQKEDLVRKVRSETSGEGVDVLLEMSGVPSAIRDGYAALKYGGQAIAFGIPSAPFEFDLANLVIFKGINIQGVVGRRLWDTWYKERQLLEPRLVIEEVNREKTEVIKPLIDLKNIVTDEFKIEDFDAAFQKFDSGRTGKVMLTLD